ncbi:MAG: N-acetylmuramoyl-L-alanine amidase [Bacillales bacterium]|nr:N-acetylmuramoyl-L-alanine amidase [Bacillales bacterium]
MLRKLVLGIVLALLILPFTGTSSKAAVSFLDVDSSHRAHKEIDYLAEGQIVTGSGGYFFPSKQVTRAEAAAMLGRALNLNGTKMATQFKDVSSGSFASGYIQSAVNVNIISGYSDGTFRPEKPVTRGEMALLIDRAFKYGGTSTTSAANNLMSRGIAQGISPNHFGSNLNITRADFSVFLARAINYNLRLNPTVTFSGDLEVNADSLNVRTGPSVNYSKIGSLSQGTKVAAAYSVGNWVYVKSSQLEGFVNEAYLEGTHSSGQGPSGSNGSDGSNGANDPLSTKMIVIDPGHGGKDPGAIGFGLQEKTVVLDTALRVKNLLEKTPFSYKLTRETDTFISLSERVAIAKNAKANIFISIHANSFNGSAKGTETYYYHSAAKNPYWEDSKLLATKIQNRLAEAMQTSDRGVKHGDFHVIRENSMPAVLTELGFIDNKQDNDKLKSAAWRQKAAEAIYLGILDYYKAKGLNVTALYNNI